MQKILPVVIATYSRRMRLRLPDGKQVIARIKGKRIKPVCADRVEAERIANEKDWLITKIDARDNELRRPNLRGQIEVLAANIELLVVVTAGSPKPDWFITDRYLCAAEDMRVAAAVVYNKTDLEPNRASAQAEMAWFSAIGYPTVMCSAETGDNMDELKTLLAGRIAIIVGQSGVGKSSIINNLTNSDVLPTATISRKSGAGRHKTVNSVMLQLQGGGAVIDSPGVRDYAPALESVAQVRQLYREIETAGRECRFNNCRHTREPGCAVKLAVADEQISARRYESYKRMLILTEKSNINP